MIVLNGKDFMEVKLASLIADYDRDVLTNLYQPIIGFTGLAAYLSLWTEANNQKLVSAISHDEFFERMRISVGQFVDARKLLEGIGLLRTFISENHGTKIYSYNVYAPRTPKEFFDNALLYGMYIKSVGEVQAAKIKNIFCIEPTTDAGKDISSSFVDAFQPDFDDPAFKKAMNSTGNMAGRVGAKIISEFSFEKFFESLKSISQIREESFGKKDMKEIERLATLYGIDEACAANGVATLYDPLAEKGKHIDFKKLASIYQDETNYTYLSTVRNRKGPSKVSGDSDIARKINIMETKSPKDYLSILQNFSKPANSDLILINEISSNFRLNNAVINALIDYTLATNNNILSRFYCEKIAASLAREGVTSAVDAMNFLNKVSKSRKQKKEAKVEMLEESKEIVNEVRKETSANDSLDWNSLIDEIDEGGSDGKA